MTAIRVYRVGDPEAVRLVSRRCAFASTDPGTEGAVLIWRQGSAVRWPAVPDVAVPITTRAGGADIAAAACARLGVRVFLIEGQFISRDPRRIGAGIRLTFFAGVVVGRVLERAEIDDVVQAQPAVWQAGLPKHSNSKQRAILHAGRLLPGWLRTVRGVGFRSGCADAFGLADWFAAGGKYEN